MAIPQHLTTAEIRAANLLAIENGTLAAMKALGLGGCSYEAGCAIGCALSKQTLRRIKEADDDCEGVGTLVDKGILTVENRLVARKLQHLHDGLSHSRRPIDRDAAEVFPVLAPHVGRPITLDLYKAVIESLPAAA